MADVGFWIKDNAGKEWAIKEDPVDPSSRPWDLITITGGVSVKRENAVETGKRLYQEITGNPYRGTDETQAVLESLVEKIGDNYGMKWK